MHLHRLNRAVITLLRRKCAIDPVTRHSPPVWQLVTQGRAPLLAGMDMNTVTQVEEVLPRLAVLVAAKVVAVAVSVVGKCVMDTLITGLAQVVVWVTPHHSVRAPVVVLA